MKEIILQLLREKDSILAIEHATRQPDALVAVEALDEAMRELYWKQKNLSRAVALGRAAVQHALTMAAAVESANTELATKLRGKARAACYNLASFTWRGWGEEGIDVTVSDEAVGFDAARANLRLAVELGKGDLPLSRAHWMLGAHQISAADLTSAEASFRLAARYGAATGERGNELLAVAFGRLTELLRHRDDPGSNSRLSDARNELAKVKDGEFYEKQVATALEVYTGLA